LTDTNEFGFTAFPNVGMEIHLVAMAFLSTMLWLRLYYSKMAGAKLIDENPAN
jgi:hypothetical protein